MADHFILIGLIFVNDIWYKKEAPLSCGTSVYSCKILTELLQKNGKSHTITR